MPSGVGLEIVLVAGFLVLLLVAVAVGRLRRGRATSTTPAPGRTAPARAEGLGARVRSLFGPGKPTEDDWRRLQEALIDADAGPRASLELVTRVRERFEPGQDPAAILREEIEAMFAGDAGFEVGERLWVVLVVGVNGSGKTTTIGKLAHRLVNQGRLVALAASDTFRAAAVPQLREWADRAGADVVAQERGSDPAAVAFDAVEAAKARGHDALIVDTAGRLHTRQPLMDELAKVKRVIEKAAGDVDEILLVLDATTGQNGIAQAKAFVEAVGVSGIALTKLDGTARGGIVLAIREQLGVPVKLVGEGEGISDLRAFDPKAFARSLLA